MKNFTLTSFCNIAGIGSASGLFFQKGEVLVVSDNGGYLYGYDPETGFLKKTPLLDADVLENIPKKIKPDFEAMSEYDGKLYIFGSGSTENRNISITLDTITGSVINRTDLSSLYQNMREISGISTDDFNLEGALHNKSCWLFFQRGNGGSGKNGIFTVPGDLANGGGNIVFIEIALPRIGRVLTSFTDAILVNGAIYFLATAEDTESTYDDGEIVGSIVGQLDPETLQIIFSQQITDSHKFEGITLYEAAESETTFLLCEDNDTNYQESEIFKLTIDS
jgi:hypothetical protein